MSLSSQWLRNTHTILNPGSGKHVFPTWFRENPKNAGTLLLRNLNLPSSLVEVELLTHICAPAVRHLDPGNWGYTVKRNCIVEPFKLTALGSKNYRYWSSQLPWYKFWKKTSIVPWTISKLMIHKIATIPWFVSNLLEVPRRTIVRSEFVGMLPRIFPVRVLGMWWRLPLPV